MPFGAEGRRQNWLGKSEVRICLGLHCLLAACLFIPRLSLAAEEQIIGFVLTLSGDWSIVTGTEETPLKGGDQVEGGSLVKPGKDTKNPYLLLAIYDGTTLGVKEATKLPSRKQKSSNRFWAAVRGRYRGRVIEAASRDDQGLLNGVVPLKDGKVDLAPVLRELPDGDWLLKVNPYRPEKPEINRLRASTTS